MRINAQHLQRKIRLCSRFDPKYAKVLGYKTYFLFKLLQKPQIIEYISSILVVELVWINLLIGVLKNNSNSKFSWNYASNNYLYVKLYKNIEREWGFFFFFCSTKCVSSIDNFFSWRKGNKIVYHYTNIKWLRFWNTSLFFDYSHRIG